VLKFFEMKLLGRIDLKSSRAADHNSCDWLTTDVDRLNRVGPTALDTSLASFVTVAALFCTCFEWRRWENFEESSRPYPCRTVKIKPLGGMGHPIGIRLAAGLLQYSSWSARARSQEPLGICINEHHRKSPLQ
jgi:hypothetical protein